MRFIVGCDISATPHSVPDPVDLGLKCAAWAFPFPAIILWAAWFHLRCVNSYLNIGIADVAQNLQIFGSIAAAMCL